jgi:hypothetical protein
MERVAGIASNTPLTAKAVINSFNSRGPPGGHPFASEFPRVPSADQLPRNDQVEPGYLEANVPARPPASRKCRGQPSRQAGTA